MRSLHVHYDSWKALLALVLLACAAPAPARTRIGLGVEAFTESSRLSGHQSIDASRQDESFDYRSKGFLSATLNLSVPASISPERARVGAGVRFLGQYGSGGEGRGEFGFGLLNEMFVSGEYGLPVADRMEAVFGARGGVALLVPGRQFKEEIQRLQEHDVDVWSVPRVGWLAGVSVGTRRRMGEHLLLRADFSGQLERLFLFATSQEVQGLDFNKNWNTFGLRLGFTLGAEFAL